MNAPRTPAQSIDLYRDLRTPRARTAVGTGPRLVAAAAALAALAIHAGFEQHALRSQRAALARVAADTERLQRTLAALPSGAAAAAAQEESEVAALERVAERLAGTSLGRTAGFSDALAALARASTDGVWLTGVSFDNPTEQFTLEGMALEADRVPQLLGALKRQPRFGGTVFARIEIRPAEDAAGQTNPAVRFRIATAKREPPAAHAAAAKEPAT